MHASIYLFHLFIYSSLIVPGYIGCYSFDPNGLPFEQYQRSAGYSDEMAIEICTSRCSKNYFAYAGLEDGSRCYCGNNAPMGIHQADRSSCMKPCNDDEKQSCGGIGHIAVYESKIKFKDFNIDQNKF